MKIPLEAFDFYAALGPRRSYRAVAERFGVSKRGVTKHAAKEGWPARLMKIEEEARIKADERAVDALQEMNERHTKIAKALQGKALQALQDMPLKNTRDMIRALDLGVRQERLILGEPTERHASVEETTKREIDMLLVAEEEDENETHPE